MGSSSIHRAADTADHRNTRQVEGTPLHASEPMQRDLAIEDLLGNEAAWPVKDHDVRAVLLAKAVEYEIIPRLMLAHRVPDECAAHPLMAHQRITPEDVALFAELVLHQDDGAVRDCVLTLRDRGVPVEAIFLDLLSPVARHLGEMWERDLCNFTEVTVGLGRLQKVLRDNSSAFRQAPDASAGLRILLMPCPGEQHTFGLSLVGELFHRAGWDVVACFLATDSAATMVQHEWFDVVGFSLGSETGIERLQEVVARVRSTSQNPGISIIVGGPIFSLHPEYGDRIGACAVVTNGQQAPDQAQALVHRRRSLA